MKFIKPKRLVFRNLQYRVFAVLILAVCVIGVKYWENYNKRITGRFSVYLQPEPETIIQNRNLLNYDFGSRIASCFNNFEIPPQVCESSKTQARNFILDHWKVKKRAYIILEFNGVDNFSEYYVFIEPDNYGKWQIVWNKEFSDFERGFAKNIFSSFATDIKLEFADIHHFPFKRNYSILVFLNDKGNKVHYY